MKLTGLWLGLTTVLDSTSSRHSVSTISSHNDQADQPIRVDPKVGHQDVNVQREAHASLKALSQPPDLASFSAADMPGYAYPASSGKGITVYIIDTGADPTHQEFIQAPGRKRWIHIPEDTRRQKSDPLGHGTCVQSLVNGPQFGAAKDADVVIVKIPIPAKPSYFTSALHLVIRDIQKKDLEGKAVVTMSVMLAGIDILKSKRRGYPVLKDNFGREVSRMRQQVEFLTSHLDVPVVAAAGNLREIYVPLSDYPGNFVDMPVITVGGMEPNGSRSYHSQGGTNEVTVLAPATVECAAAGRSREARDGTGTSYAAPRVAGMIATWLSSPQYGERLGTKGKVVVNVKRLMKELAYVKMPASERGGGYPIAYNGFGMFTHENELKHTKKPV